MEGRAPTLNDLGVDQIFSFGSLLTRSFVRPDGYGGRMLNFSLAYGLDTTFFQILSIVLAQPSAISLPVVQLNR